MVRSLTLRLQILKLVYDIRDAWAVLQGVEVVVTDYQGVGVAMMEVLQKSAKGCLLRLGARVGGLTADVETTLVAYANGVAVVVHAVGADHPFRSAWLYLSVTTDNVVVADAELKTTVSVPCVYLGSGRCLVGCHRTAMNDD